MTRELTRPAAAGTVSSQSRLSTLMGVQIIGVGSSTPANVVRNEDLASLGYDADWIVQRSGIRERRHALPGEATSDFAAEAARRCIEDAGVDPQDVELVIVGTFTPDLLLPSTACLVQDRLGLRAPAIDLHAACASFVMGLVTGAQFIAAGTARLVLVIGADCNSRVVDPADQHTYPLFGDGAGAVLLASGDKQQGLLAYSVGADGSGADLLCRPMGGTRMPFAGEASGLHFMKMEGRAVFKWAVRMLHDTVSDVLRAADKTVDDLDLVILHQANLRIINTAARDLGIPEHKLYNNLERFGNTAAASVPLALDEVYRQGRIRRGDCVLFSGFGAGLAWGTALVQW